jgi:rhomboid protease GluP
MNESANGFTETILQQCAAAAPEPWYPSAYASSAGISRDSLDTDLDLLRLGGVIQLTDWVKGRGQGYRLTEAGKQVLVNPHLLEQLRAGTVAVGPTATDDIDAPLTVAPDTERTRIVQAALDDSSRPVVTRLLIAANCAVFLVGAALALRADLTLGQYAKGDDPRVVQLLHTLGGIRGTDLYFHNEWWRLLTCCFVHGSFLHLLTNMISLWVLGDVQEAKWGRGRFLIIYLLSGAVGSCAMILPNPDSTGVGASGAIYGLMSSLVVWVVANRRYIGSGAMPWLRRLLIIFALSASTSFLPHVSKEAHLGGGLAGLVVASLLQFQRFGRGAVRWLAPLGIVLVPVLGIAVVQAHRPKERQAWEVTYMPQLRAAEEQIQDLTRNRVDPLLKEVGKAGADEETLRNAREAAAQVRQRLAETVALLKQAGPFTDSGVEKEREAYLEWFHTYLSRIEFIELIDLYYPQTRRAEEEALSEAAATLQPARVQQFLQLPPEARDAVTSRALATSLEESRTKIVQADSELKKSGPYNDAEIEAARVALEHCLQAELAWLGRLVSWLQQGIAATAETADELTRLKKEIGEAQKERDQKRQALEKRGKQLFPRKTPAGA